MRKLILSALAATLLAPAAQASEQAKNVIDRMIRKESERAAGLESYIVRETHTDTVVSVQYYEKYAPINNEFLGYRLVSPAELQADADPATAALLLSAANEATPAATWIGGILLGEGSPDRESVMNAHDGYTNFVSGLNQARHSNIEETHEGMIQARKDLREFGEKAVVADVKDFEGREAYYLIARDVDKKQVTEDGEFVMNNIGLIVDTEFYEPLQMRVEGVSKTKEGEQPFVIAQTMLNYKAVEGSSYRIPHKRISLVEFDFMKGKDIREFEKAKKEYAKMQEELAQLPPEAQRMMEGMMGDQMRALEKQFETMVDQHAFGNEAIVNEARAGGVETYVDMLKDATKE